MTFIYNVCDKKSGLIVAQFTAKANRLGEAESAKKQAQEYAKKNKNYWVSLRWQP